MVCNGGDGLDNLGIVLDPKRNMAVPLTTPEIQSDDSRVKILVIPTDEALEIARQTCVLLYGPISNTKASRNVEG